MSGAVTAGVECIYASCEILYSIYTSVLTDIHTYINTVAPKGKENGRKDLNNDYKAENAGSLNDMI